MLEKAQKRKWKEQALIRQLEKKKESLAAEEKSQEQKQAVLSEKGTNFLRPWAV